jgi:predicted RNA-binding Zn-ribbon protein involved in translation (DUF1610 family)
MPMAEVQSSALCGACKVPMEGPVDASNETVFTCPKCGRSDTKAVILAELQDYITDQAKRLLNAGLQGVETAMKGNRFITAKVTPFETSNREYRYVTDAEIR